MLGVVRIFNKVIKMDMEFRVASIVKTINMINRIEIGMLKMAKMLEVVKISKRDKMDKNSNLVKMQTINDHRVGFMVKIRERMADRMGSLILKMNHSRFPNRKELQAVRTPNNTKIDYPEYMIT